MTVLCVVSLELDRAVGGVGDDRHDNQVGMMASREGSSDWDG